MKSPIAACGLDCSSCKARLATLNNDDALKEEVAREWSELNQVLITPEMINCVGCLEEGPKTIYCEKLCPIRKCCLNKKLDSCANCGDFANCQKLKAITSNNEEALLRLIKTKVEKNGEIVFESSRLYFRKHDDNDLIPLTHILPSDDRAYAKRWITWCEDSYVKNGFGLYAVILKNSGELIGTAGISMQYIDEDWRPEVGYHLRKDYHRQGLGKEMAIASRDYFFTHFDFGEVYSYMKKDNVASYKTAEANGMTYLHLSKDKNGEVCRIYKITRKEWETIK